MSAGRMSAAPGSASGGARWRRGPCLALIVAYLASSGWFAARHVAGDPGPHPISYFWTWDMFPFYETESLRPMVIAEDEDGRVWELTPGPFDQFRWGVHGQAARTDLDRRYEMVQKAAQIAADRFARQSAAPRLASALMVERYWSLKRNRKKPSTDSPTGEEADRVYFRVVARAEVSAEGRWQWRLER